jgi:hypothetical protein
MQGKINFFAIYVRHSRNFLVEIFSGRNMLHIVSGILMCRDVQSKDKISAMKYP